MTFGQWVWVAPVVVGMVLLLGSKTTWAASRYDESSRFAVASASGLAVVVWTLGSIAISILSDAGTVIGPSAGLVASALGHLLLAALLFLRPSLVIDRWAARAVQRVPALSAAHQAPRIYVGAMRFLGVYCLGVAGVSLYLSAMG